MLATSLVLVVALLHGTFMVLEMLLWATPIGQRVFERTRAEQEATAPLAKNQGLYNGFLAAGLVWAAFAHESALALRMFFLGCVVVAGVYGAATASKKILYVQALPGLIALAVTWLAR